MKVPTKKMQKWTVSKRMTSTISKRTLSTRTNSKRTMSTISQWTLSKRTKPGSATIARRYPQARGMGP